MTGVMPVFPPSKEIPPPITPSVAAHAKSITARDLIRLARLERNKIPLPCAHEQ